MNLGQEMHKVESGRVFVRAAAALPDMVGRSWDGIGAATERLRNAVLLVGVIEIPRSVEVERMHDVRLNDHLWIDVEKARRPRTHWQEAVKEMDVGGVLTDFQYARGFLPDAFEVFVRATMLPHDKPYMRWAYIMAPVAHRLAALPKDGLYEFDASSEGFRHLSGNVHTGEPPSAILRQAQWGPGGGYGFSTSMDPGHYPSWVAGERTKNPDRRFKAFAALANARCPERHVYSAEQLRYRDAVCAQVIREVMAMSEADLDAALATAEGRATMTG
jgi:hypothetical protein